MRDVRLGAKIVGVSYVRGESGLLSASQRRGNCEGRAHEDVGIDYEASCRIPTPPGAAPGTANPHFPRNGMKDGLTAMGFSIGTGHSNFPGGGGAALQGPHYGILRGGDNPATGNAVATGGDLLVKDTVVFTRTTASGLALSDLSGTVVSQYGTALTDTHYAGRVPEPTETALLACSTLLFGGFLRRVRWSVF